MFVWRKRAGIVWLAANEATLREVAGRRLAIISRPGRKNAIAEIAGSNRPDLESIRSRFGGIIEKLPRDWLTRFSRAQTIKPIRIGKQLVVTRKFSPSTEIITSNLFSELLIEILPKLKRVQWLILSGILREQEARLVRALNRNGIAIAEMRRRGKWIATLAQPIKSGGF